MRQIASSFTPKSQEFVRHRIFSSPGTTLLPPGIMFAAPELAVPVSPPSVAELTATGSVRVAILLPA